MYRLIRKTVNNGYVADFLAVTKKKNYGWKPVKNVTIRRELQEKF